MKTSTVRTQHLMDLQLKTGPACSVGAGPAGERRIVPILGGQFQGERLRGTVEPFGTDWLIVAAGDTFRFDARLTLRTDDAQVIALTYRGYRHGSAEVMARLNRREPVDPESYYFRTAPFFETAAAQYDWLNRIVAVGVGQRTSEGPLYTILEVL